jgi:hypothetical protein
VQQMKVRRSEKFRGEKKGIVELNSLDWVCEALRRTGAGGDTTKF